MSADTLEAGTTSPTPVLELRNASVRFGARTGVGAVNLALGHGERVALLGPSGAGKTSLLRAMAGLDAFATGELLIDGVQKTHAPPEQRRVVYLHQTPSLFPHLTVRDNVAFPLILRGTRRADARAMAAALLDTMHLSALADRMPEKLSGGERHRTALARALAADPLVLLLDEPFSALDPGLRHEIRAEVLSILSRASSPATIVVTHDVDEATLFGERIAVLLDGRIQQCDDAQDVVRTPATVGIAQFLGVPNVVPGTCVKRDDHIVEWTSILGASQCPTNTGAANTHGANTHGANMVAVGWAEMLAVLPVGASGAPGVVMAVEHRGFGRVVRVQLDRLVVVGVAAPDAEWVVGDPVTVAMATQRPHLLPVAGEPS